MEGSKSKCEYHGVYNNVTIICQALKQKKALRLKKVWPVGYPLGLPSILVDIALDVHKLAEQK